MFSKSRINEPGPKAGESETKPAGETSMPKPPASSASSSAPMPSTPKAKAPASTLSSDLTVVGNLRSTGDILVEGTIEGDIRAHMLTVGESATVKGEVVADDVVVNGRKNGNSVMPHFGDNPNVMCYLNDIYVYLAARGMDAVPRGRPSKKEPKSDLVREMEDACMG